MHVAITHDVLILAQRSEIHGASYKIAKLYAGCHFGSGADSINTGRQPIFIIFAILNYLLYQGSRV